jgi:hypothetical protein
MNLDMQSPARNTSDQAAAAAFNGWIRRVVKGAAELRALNAGELDAVMDPATGGVILLPEAQLALNGSNRVVRGVFDVLPGQICVLDSAGTIIMANDAWRAFGARHAGAGISVREGDNFLAVCRTAEGAGRKRALVVAAGLRQVIMGARSQFRCEYVCDTSAGRCAFTLVIARIARAGASHFVVTRTISASASAPCFAASGSHPSQGFMSARARMCQTTARVPARPGLPALATA